MKYETAGGPVIKIAESRKSCALFIAFFAMSGRWDKIAAGKGWSDGGFYKRGREFTH